MLATIDELEQEPTEPASRKRNRRAEAFGLTFVDCRAEGWAFDVCEPFRAAMDINYATLVDMEKTKAARRSNPQAKSIHRRTWTRGVPPLLSFERGHVFYDPPGVRSMVWSEALKVLWRAVRVMEAAPDGDNDRNGWVLISIEHYNVGKVARHETCRCSQADFEVLLRSGKLPGARTKSVA